MAGKRRRNSRSASRPRVPARQRSRWLAAMVLLFLIVAALAALTQFESYASLYDATYVGSQECGECHTQVYEEWRTSPHALMTRRPTPESVVGNFENHEWYLPRQYRSGGLDSLPAARMGRSGEEFYMELRRPGSAEYDRFGVDYVIGYQYRQVYLTREGGGVLRRLPLQWSNSMRSFFPYWNVQEGSAPSVDDFRAQMRSMNSAWNLFCARCHTTNLVVDFKTSDHTRAKTRWTDDGIACESCHGPGSQHANYFAHNYVNRVVAFLNSTVRGEPAAYIASAQRMAKGQDMSVCARCHGPDIMMASTEIYRRYEPGYSRLGRINDLSDHFKEFPLQPGRQDPTVECWDDGRPKGIGMLFRSFIESACYEKSEVRCYHCHDPHANKKPRAAGLLEPSETSNTFCVSCHANIEKELQQHTRHKAGTEGSFCYDCHMPRNIMNLVSGSLKYTRTHTMSSIPRPELSREYGLSGSPNACNECHGDRTVEWAMEKVSEWWGDGRQ